MEKLLHYYFSWIVSFQKQIYTSEVLPLETKQSEGKRLPPSDLWGSVPRRNIQQQALQQVGLQRKEEGTAQLQDSSVECKNLESRWKIGKI
jgi:hypothetical protein